jgi:predicted membrane-bound spermidine synthase
MGTYKEVQAWGETLYTVLNGSHTSFNTGRAKIDLITNPYYGRMLFIDGVLQSAESDEKIYHNALVNSHKQPKHILIAGGAEGALAKELFTLDSVLNVVMVDWDEELVSHMKKEPFAGNAFTDPRLKIVHKDILEYINVSNTTEDRFDTIILDLLDPRTDTEVDWLMNIVLLCLKKWPNISMNAGGDIEIRNKILNRLYATVPYDYYVSSKSVFVPSFQQEWYLIAIIHI